MATQTIKLTGIGSWAKVYEGNRDMNEAFHGPEGAYTINLSMDTDMADTLAASGSRLKMTPDEDGLTVKFKRKHVNEAIPEFGGPPQVVDADMQPFTGMIGNGSTVEVAVTVYDTKLGKGTRLEGVRVIDLVEYESASEGTPALPFG